MNYTLIERANVVHSYIAREESMFKLVGAWVPSANNSAVVSFLSTESAHHGWRMSQWEALRPRSVEPDTADLAPQWAAALAFCETRSGDVDRLGAWLTVLLSNTLQRYEHHANSLSEPADNGLARMLSIMEHDCRLSVEAGSQLLGTVAEDPLDTLVSRQMEEFEDFNL